MPSDKPPPIPRSPWRVVVAIFVLIVALVLSIPVGFHLYGKYRWASVQADLRAKGEKLTAKEMMRPSVPDAENFFADPLWEEVRKRAESKEETGTTGWDRLNPPVTKEEKERLQAKYPGIAWPEKSSTRTSVVLTAWSKRPENAPPEELKRTAYYIQEALLPAAPYLEKMESLSARPKAVYPLELEKGMAMSLPHVKYLLQAGQLFSMRARAEILLGNPAKALVDVEEILSLSDRFKNEPALISYLVRISLMGMAVDVIAGGTKVHAWSSAQLQQFERRFASYRFLPELQEALRAERVSFNATMGSLRRGDIDGLLKSSLEDGETPSKTAGKMLASIWYSENGNFDQAAYNSLKQEWIEELQSAAESGLASKSGTQQKLEAWAANPYMKITHLMTVLAMPSEFGAQAKMAETQDRVSMARIACALERFWLKNGKYPESLAELGPEYLAEPLRSVVDLQPFHYKLEPPAGYLLYSVGIDHKDDGGRPAYKSEPGDWVWGRVGKAPTK